MGYIIYADGNGRGKDYEELGEVSRGKTGRWKAVQK